MPSATASLELANRIEEVNRLRAFVQQFASNCRLSGEVVGELRLALEETVTNVVQNAYDDGRAHTIRVELAREVSCVTARVEDDGRPFDPLSRPIPPVDRPVAERPVGGLGVWLVRNTMDEVGYRREQDKNILVMRKYLPADG
jgi:serine/threonine-protein kinase RsbW